MLGCLLCITGSVTIVLHAPPERHLGSVVEVFQLAMQPGAGGGGAPTARDGGGSGSECPSHAGHTGIMLPRQSHGPHSPALPQRLSFPLPRRLACTAFLGYAAFATLLIVFLIFYVAPQHGPTNIFVYISICSLAGSLSVMSCKVGRRCVPLPPRTHGSVSTPGRAPFAVQCVLCP